MTSSHRLQLNSTNVLGTGFQKNQFEKLFKGLLDTMGYQSLKHQKSNIDRHLLLIKYTFFIYEIQKWTSFKKYHV